jgi:hypothetical protein
MTKTHVSQMTEAKAAARLAEIKRGPRPEPEPLPLGKHARELSEAERAEWLREHIRRFQ